MKTLSVRIPDELHKESNEVLEQIGLDVPTAFRIFLTQVAVTRSIPFTLRVRDSEWERVPVDRENQEAMDEVAALWGGKPAGR
ncbi:MAG: type II toxin-antitoxin system RelB/DinJ family antitoxin [Pedosphaera sp.]|nr:type II toxin-antitoxin system RelB/DinJ family antitoxin [Pedosphaera sp.]